MARNVMLMLEFHLPYEYFEEMDALRKAEITGVVEAHRSYMRYRMDRQGGT